MHNKKYDLDISKLPSQIQEDVVQIFQWFNENIIKLPSLDATENIPSANTRTSVNKIEHMLEFLDYPYADFKKDHYITHLAEKLGRKIVLVPMELSRAVSGACVRQFHVDYIFYNQKRHPLLQNHIILHESAHLLLNHRLRKVMLPDSTEYEGNLPDQSRVRFRSHLIFRDIEQEIDEVEQRQEEEAEAFARLFVAHIQTQRREINLGRTQNINLFPPFSNKS